MTTQKEYFKQYWIKNRTKINKKHREYYKKINGDWHKEYYQKNRERILTSHKEYYWNIRRNLICKFNKKLFSKQDDAIIKKWFGKITAKEIHKKYIPNWDTKSIITRANRLGLKSNTSFLHEGRRNYFFGKHHSKETKRKLSIANTGRFIGEENPAYKDGKGREPYPMGWHEGLREKIRIRDNHNCLHSFSTAFAIGGWIKMTYSHTLKGRVS
jgi:hypothetical protein